MRQHRANGAHLITIDSVYVYHVELHGFTALPGIDVEPVYQCRRVPGLVVDIGLVERNGIAGGPAGRRLYSHFQMPFANDASSANAMTSAAKRVAICFLIRIVS